MPVVYHCSYQHLVSIRSALTQAVMQERSVWDHLHLCGSFRDNGRVWLFGEAEMNLSLLAALLMSVLLSAGFGSSNCCFHNAVPQKAIHY